MLKADQNPGGPGWLDDAVAAIQAEFAAWRARLTADRRPIQRRFTTDDARIKLSRRYPQLHE